MIEAYFRPETLEEAIRLLGQDPVSRYPLGGGNVLSRSDAGKIAVVDLQMLNLNKIQVTGMELSIGANTTLQALIENEQMPKAIKDAAVREGTINNRQTGTIAGTLVSSRGQSPLGAVLLAMGTRVSMAQNKSVVAMEEWMSSLESEKPSRLVTGFIVSLEGKTSYKDISKTPADVPFVFSAMNKNQNGEKRWVLGLKKSAGLFIGRGADDKELTKNAHSHYSTSQILSIYQKQTINVLFARLSAALSAEERA